MSETDIAALEKAVARTIEQLGQLQSDNASLTRKLSAANKKATASAKKVAAAEKETQAHREELENALSASREATQPEPPESSAVLERLEQLERHLSALLG